MKIELEDSFVTSCQIARDGDYDYRLCRLILIDFYFSSNIQHSRRSSILECSYIEQIQKRINTQVQHKHTDKRTICTQHKYTTQKLHIISYCTTL